MKFHFLIFLLLFINNVVYCQESKNTFAQSNENDIRHFVLEKLYLHTDRLSYVAGEDIWYKAYLADAENNQLTSHSNNLYVELISPENKIIQRQNIHVYQGGGNGDFKLSEDLSTGTYHLRAYTNWMRNFKETLYYKPIHIVSVKNNKELNEAIHYKADVDLQFFPEGGSLTHEVNSTIAYKAINPLGLGIDVQGFITNSLGDTITDFASSHLGMGKFDFAPNINLEYFAIGSTKDGFIFKKELPKIQFTGINIKILYVYENQIILSVNTNSECLADLKNKNLIIQNSCNKLLSQTRLNLNSLSDTIILPVFSFPAGVSKLSLMTEEEIPIAERLVFIPKNQDAKIQIQADSQIYHTRSKVNLDLKIEGDFDDNAEANFSLAAVNQTSINPNDVYASNISSYYLIESEVKGFIEQPGYYFDAENEDRLENLDLLLMTQAWRDFKWKYQTDSISNLVYAVENEFSIIERLRIYIDSTVNPPPDINPMSYIKTKISKGVIDDIREDAFYKKMIKTRYGLNDTVVLNEFEKIASRIEAEKKDEHLRIYEPLKKSDTHEMDGYELGYKNIIEFLRGRFAGLEILGQEPNIIIQIRGPGSLTQGSEPLWLLDGMPVERDRILDFEVEEVDKIEILKGAGAGIFGVRGKNGVISVLSKQARYGLDTFENQDKQKALGKYDYFKQRKFYAPKYDHTQTENKAPDYRNTIHWEPFIYSDENDEAQISFYNSDGSGTIQICAEGLTRSGIPIMGKATYKVK